MVLKCTI